MHDIWSFLAAHWYGVAIFLVTVLPSIIVGLSNHPNEASILNTLLQVLSVLTHRDSPGTFKPPGVKGPPPALIALLAFSLAFGAFAGPNPEALKDAVASDPTAVQPGADTPPPPPPQFGGCIRNGKLCFGPSIALTVAAINLKTKVIEGAFSAGLGYGLTLNKGKWSSIGADAYFNLDPAAQRASASFMVSLMNGYLRVGLSKGIIGDVAWRVPLAIGLGF